MTIPKKQTWFVLGIIRNEENVAFERSIDKAKGILEFYVPTECEPQFIRIINILKNDGYITNITKQRNRLEYEPL